MRNEMLNVISARLADVAAQVLSQISGTVYQGRLSDTEAGVDPGEYQTLELFIRGSVDASIGLQLGAELFKTLGGALLGSPVSSDLQNVESRQAVEEFWRQVIGRANTQTADVLHGRELDVKGVSDGRQIPGTIITVEIGTTERWIPWRIVFSADAEHCLTADASNREAVLPALESCGHDNIGILLDIPLSVTLRFGSKRLPLSEILQLTSGAVIELDRHTEEPVDLCLEGRVIARGSVVVVDGCYGLRITELLRKADVSHLQGCER